MDAPRKYTTERRSGTIDRGGSGSKEEQAILRNKKSEYTNVSEIVSQLNCMCKQKKNFFGRMISGKECYITRGPARFRRDVEKTLRDTNGKRKRSLVGKTKKKEHRRKGRGLSRRAQVPRSIIPTLTQYTRR